MPKYGQYYSSRCLPSLDVVMLAHHVARLWTWAKRTAIKPLPYGQYHYDDETVTCLAFRFTGCGGNSNNFLSKTECHDNCLPTNRPPVTSCNDERKCPEGSTCQRGYMIGLCCDNKDIGNCTSVKHTASFSNVNLAAISSHA
ncbi:hypothetical protein Q1695_005343 [Nippostrongylus brasiliensis]|nr:hypothetical protein Q1695_005343 [Nippostrongylus brasiliensis]